MEGNPKVTIITAVLNGDEFVRSAVDSVLAQTYPDVEYIVKDGGSTDRTLDVLAPYERELTIVSQRDAGIYDALNQAIPLATGDIIGVLHADDFYAGPRIIEGMMEAMARTGAEVAWGDLVCVERQNPGRIIRRWKSSAYREGKFLRGWHPPHPTFFVRKRVYERFGMFRTDLSIAADYELMLRLLERNHVPSCYVPETVVIMRAGGRSNRAGAILWRSRIEDARAWRLNGLAGGPLAAILKPLSKIRQFFG